MNIIDVTWADPNANKTADPLPTDGNCVANFSACESASEIADLLPTEAEE